MSRRTMPRLSSGSAVPVEQGHVDAQFNLGVMYAEGRGVPQDDDVAVKLFLSAAVHGHPRAQFRLSYF